MDHLNILLIEDNLEDSTWVDIQLKKAAMFTYTLQVCDYFSRALKLLEDHKFSLIILDLTLPDSNGLDGLKTLVKSTNLPIIIYTGISNKLVQEQAFKTGVKDYLIKGKTSVEELKKCILECIENGRNK